jgi:hydrogenase-4 component F
VNLEAAPFSQTDQLHLAILVMAGAPFVAALLFPILFRSRRVLNWITVGVSLLSLLLSIVIARSPAGWNKPYAAIPWIRINFYLDGLSVYFLLLVNLVALIASFYAIQFLAFDARHNQNHYPRIFHSMFNLFHGSMLLVPLVDNLVALWVAVELTTVFSTMLVSYRRDRASLEAAWKFIMITTTGIIFALLGTLFLSMSIPDGQISPGQDAMSWTFLAQLGSQGKLEQNFVMLSFLFILIGYGTKAGLAPMHTWLPDGHGQAPPPVSALLSGVMLKSALYAILRYYTITNLSLGAANRFTSWLLLSAGLFSLVLVTPFILKRNRFKRLLAYHSVEHMGIITFGIGLGTPLALYAALLHALNHALTKSLMFLVYGSVQYEYTNRLAGDVEEGEVDQHITGVLKVMPVSGTILGLGGLALVGSPPFNIFMSELMILWAAFLDLHGRAPSTGGGMAGEGLLVVLSIILFMLTVTLIFGGLVGHLARILLGKAPFPVVETTWWRSPWLVVFIGLMFLVLVSGLTVPGFPVDLSSLLNESATILTDGPAETGGAFP